MLWWAFKANFANLSRRPQEDISFKDMSVKRPRTELKTVTHVYAHCVTHVCAQCRVRAALDAEPQVSVSIPQSAFRNPQSISGRGGVLVSFSIIPSLLRSRRFFLKKTRAEITKKQKEKNDITKIQEGDRIAQCRIC